MKKFLLGSLLALTTFATSFACWFTQYNFKSNYIAGVNNFIKHTNIDEITNFEDVQYFNNMYADLPLTVWIKIAPRINQYGSGTSYFITEATLQYRVKHGNKPWGNWINVKTIKNVGWNLNFSNPVALFGRNNINPKGLVKDDLIMIRLYLLSDDDSGTVETGDKDNNGPSSVGSPEYYNTEYNWDAGGWTPPYIMVIKYSGKKRPVR